MKINKWILLLSAFVFFIQCDSPHFYQEQRSTNNDWNENTALTFEFEVKDTLSVYDFYLLSRNNNDFQYSNLYLLTEMKTPVGTVFADTLQYYLAYQDGEWIGTGNSLKELYLLYREGIALKDTGTYTLSVRHGMREQNLVGIEDISLIIDKKEAHEKTE
ncbi:MAG TPA: gliding motility lipoprotein GldH [Moheibacter sp.]|nr:gliding motility lipoprotein GldH [Moheibacter sp.]